MRRCCSWSPPSQPVRRRRHDHAAGARAAGRRPRRAPRRDGPRATVERRPAGGQPGEERLPGQHEPRAADAAQRDHRLQRPDAPRAAATAAACRPARVGRAHPQRRRSTCSTSSTTSSTWPRSRPAGWSSIASRSTSRRRSAESVAGLRPLAERKRILTSRSSGRARSSTPTAAALRQILYNLLSNAIKFTPGRRRASRSRPRPIADGVRIDGRRHRRRHRRRGPGRRLRGVPAGRRRRRSGRGDRPGPGPHPPPRRGPRRADRARIRPSASAARFTRRPAALSAAPCRRAAARRPRSPSPGARADGRRVLSSRTTRARSACCAAYLEPRRLPGPRGDRRRAGLGDGPGRAARRRSCSTSCCPASTAGRSCAGSRPTRICATSRSSSSPSSTSARSGLALGAVDYLVKPVDRDALLACLGRLATHAKARTRARHAGPGRRRRPGGARRSSRRRSARRLRRRPAPRTAGRPWPGHGRSCPTWSSATWSCPTSMASVSSPRLKGDPRTRPCPIVILTAHDLSAADKRRLNGKVLGIVTKGTEAQAGLRAWLVRADRWAVDPMADAPDASASCSSRTSRPTAPWSGPSSSRSTSPACRARALEAGTSPRLATILAEGGRTSSSSDVRLPDGNGLDLAAEMRADQATAARRVVIVSASVLPVGARGALGSGADAFLGKPFAPTDLIELSAVCATAGRTRRSGPGPGPKWSRASGSGASSRSSSRARSFVGRAPVADGRLLVGGCPTNF